MTGTGPRAVSISGLRRSFGERRVLDGIDLEIPAGQFVALLGASGSGKTTILRMLAGLDVPDAGTVLVPAARTVVFQEPRLVQSDRVWRNVTLGQRRTKGVKEAARAALEEVGLSNHVDAWPATLSGGEAQRVALARALVRSPQLLLLDEPFAALDALTRLKMQDLIDALRRRHRPAVLLVTHDVDEAIRLADRILVLREGRLSIDRLIELPWPRERDAEGTAWLRRELLAELGVVETEQVASPA